MKGKFTPMNGLLLILGLACLIYYFVCGFSVRFGLSLLWIWLLLGLVLNNFPSLTLPFDYSTLLTPLVIIWYIVSELGSILENSANMGAPIPGFLKRALEKVKASCDSAAEDENKSGKVG